MKYTRWLSLPLALALATAPAFATEAKDFADLVDIVNRYSLFTYEEQLSDEVLAPYQQGVADGELTATQAIDALIQEIDHYGHFFSAQDYANTYSDLQGFVGVGVVFQQAEKGCSIVRVLPESPAQAAGLQAGDCITHVDGTSVIGLTLDEVQAKIEGEAGSIVTLTYTRMGISHKNAITRAIVHEATIFTENYAQNVLYMQVTGFSNTAEITEFVGEWQAQDPADAPAVILDLRDNGGGIVADALLLANAFVDERDILLCTQITRGKETHQNSNGDGIAPRELTILVNDHTASAAELLAGVLADAVDATLVGQTTYGKGMGQQHVILTNDDCLVLTSMALSLPETGMWDGVGLTVDEQVPDWQGISTYFAENPITAPLAFGQTGEQVTALTRWLTALGYLPQPTNTLDASVLCAVQTFCLSQQLPLPTTEISQSVIDRLWTLGGIYDTQGYGVDSVLLAVL